MVGLFNEMTYFNGVYETVQDILKHYDECPFGGSTRRWRLAPSPRSWLSASWDAPLYWTMAMALGGAIHHGPPGMLKGHGDTPPRVG
jgi:arylsulfatase